MRGKLLSPLVLLLVLYIATRFLNPLSVPVFSDEGIYMSWGNALFDRLHREFPFFIAIDGKQTAVPFTFGLVQMLPLDPLFTVRLVSILAGAITTIATYKTFRLLFPQKGSLIFLLLLIFTPFTLFFDRLALPDAMVVCSYSLAFYFTALFREKYTLKRCALVGIVTGLGWWYKSSALMAIPAFMVSLIMLKMKDTLSWRKFSVSLIITIVSCLLIMLPLLIHPMYQSSPFKDTLRVTLSGVGNERLIQKVVRQLSDVSQWLVNFVSPFAVIASVIAIGMLRKNKNLLFPLVWLVVPIIVTSFLLTQLMTRWLVMTIPPFLILAGFVLSQNSKLLKTMAFFTLIYHILATTILITYPLKFYTALAVLPALKRDLSQYYIGWTSGYGVKETADWIVDKSKEKDILVFARVESGNPTDALFAYLRDEPYVAVTTEQYFWDKVYSNNEFLNDPNRPDFYFVSRGKSMGDMLQVTKEVVRFPKPLDSEFIGVYKVELPDNAI